MNVVPQIKRGPKRNVGHLTYGTPFWPTFAFWFEGLAVNPHTEFEASSHTQFRDIEDIKWDGSASGDGEQSAERGGDIEDIEDIKL